VLPQTGSPIDMDTLIGLGSLIVLLGIMMLYMDKRENRELAA
jgi:LPXTG-motif cell wall-anchored protein